jgi:hypothetical protein
MSYFAPYIDSSGLHVPTYSDIQTQLIESFKSIYGQDCYLENDSADYQWISIVANKIYDVIQALQLEYTNRSVATGVGVALDGLVKNNGLTRKSASYSTCVVKITGVYGTIIPEGVVQDLSGYYWDLEEDVEIPISGEVSVSCICQTIGAITALPASIVSIASPQRGWTSVTNEVSAVVGLPVETDSELRARQALSTSYSSHTTLAAAYAGIAAVENVTRYNIHENQDSEIDEFLCPGHSITCVVEGGTDLAVATAIYLNRGIGCLTYNGGGSSAVDQVVVDADTLEEFTVGFSRPSSVPIYVTATVTPFTGYTTSITDQIKEAIVGYLNSLQIGQTVTVSGIIAAIMVVTPDIIEPLFSVQVCIGKVASPTNTDDIEMAFYEVAEGIDSDSPEYIEVEVV